MYNQIIPFIGSLAQGIQNKGRTDITYFDYAKAFDSVNHDITLHRLKYQFKMDGTMLNFHKSYFRNII